MRTRIFITAAVLFMPVLCAAEQAPLDAASQKMIGKQGETRERFTTTFAVAPLRDGPARSVWVEKARDLETMLQNTVNPLETAAEYIFSSTNYIPHSLNNERR